MIKTLITLAIGVYTGIYVAQNYDVPPVSDPHEIIKKVKEYAEKHKKADD